MGYRGTRAQLETRLAALSVELEALREELSEASRKVDALREVQWGWLGVQWFRFTLRRALRDVDAGPRHNGTIKGLTKAVERHERALTQGRDVLRWLHDSLAPEPSEEAPARSTRPDPAPSPVSGWVRGTLGVIGAGARIVWAYALPLLLTLGAVVGLLLAIGGGADADDFDVDDDGLDQAPPSPPEARHAADVSIGASVLAFGVVFVTGGVGLWWWLR